MKDIYERDAEKRGLTIEVQAHSDFRPIDPPVGTRFSDGVKVVEWDGKNWREPASGRIA